MAKLATEWSGQRIAEAPPTGRRFVLRRHVNAVIGGGLIALFLVLGVIGPYIVPYDPSSTNLARVLESPSLSHPLGTDELGRDIFSRILGGIRVSILIGVSAVGLAVVAGVPLGSLAAFYQGRLSDLILAFANVLLTFPTIILAITIISVIGIGITGVVIAAGVSMSPVLIRLTYSSVLSVKQEDFVEAARAIGASDLLIIRRHLLPNSLSPLLVQATLGVGTTILTAAGLGFLGLGVQPPAPELGAMLSQARAYLMVAAHTAIFPGIVVAFLVLGFNLLGDGLRDALDPHRRNR
jgi:ABC-type dipeptide/oligopeptide/nickel transport system permease subunit